MTKSIRYFTAATKFNCFLALSLGISLIGLNLNTSHAASVNATDGSHTSVTWQDASWQPRKILIRNDLNTYTQLSYFVDGVEQTDNAVVDGGRLVHHGSQGCGRNGGGWQWTESTQDISELVSEVNLSGDHHAIIRRKFRMNSCSRSDLSWRITVDYLFVDGWDGFVQTVAYDSSDIGDNEIIEDDMRGPYGQFDWETGGVGGRITGMGWGTQYKFQTTSPLTGQGSSWLNNMEVVDWRWEDTNMVPYVKSWAHPEEGGVVDREYGVVQNQNYIEQDFGGGSYYGGQAWASPPPLSGNSLPIIWNMPTQMSGYQDEAEGYPAPFTASRITWGTTSGAFDTGHANDTGTIQTTTGVVRPVNAWSWTHVFGKHSDDPVAKVVTDTEAIYRTSLTASTGSVWTRGPRGPGNFVGPTLGGVMPEIDYAVAGYDFRYRAWRIEADSDKVIAELQIDSGAALAKPLIVINNYNSAEHHVALDGQLLTSGSDVLTSYDAATQSLYLTLNSVLADGTHQLIVDKEAIDLASLMPPTTTDPTSTDPDPNEIEPVDNDPVQAADPAEPNTDADPMVSADAPSVSSDTSTEDAKDAASSDDSEADAEIGNSTCSSASIQSTSLWLLLSFVGLACLRRTDRHRQPRSSS